jgi:ABC-type transporter Mla subunit MlaD
MYYWNSPKNVPVRAVLQGSLNGPNVGVPVKYKGVEIGSVIDILLSVEEVEVETV